jgi:hypothetical protein
MKQLAATGIVLMTCAALQVRAAEPNEPQPPNILLFLVDDMGLMDAAYPVRDGETIRPVTP